MSVRRLVVELAVDVEVPEHVDETATADRVARELVELVRRETPLGVYDESPQVVSLRYYL